MREVGYIRASHRGGCDGAGWRGSEAAALATQLRTAGVVPPPANHAVWESACTAYTSDTPAGRFAVVRTVRAPVTASSTAMIPAIAAGRQRDVPIMASSCGESSHSDITVS